MGSIKTTSISMAEEQLEAARRSAEQAGLSFSAYIARCEQDARQRLNGKRYRDYLASLDGEDREFSGDWYETGRNRILFNQDAS